MLDLGQGHQQMAVGEAGVPDTQPGWGWFCCTPCSYLGVGQGQGAVDKERQF